MYHVMNLKSPGEVWTKLEIQFMSKSITNKLYLKQRLYGLKIQEGSDLAQHVNIFNQIITDLARLDVNIEDEDRAMTLLCSLPFSYEHPVTTLTYGKETIKVDEITVAFVDSQPVETECRGKFSRRCLYVKGNQDRGRKSENEGSGKQNSRSKSRGRNTIHCYKCKESGHMKRDCSKLKKKADEKRDDSSKSANVVQNDDSDCSDGDMLSVSINQYVDAWILDFGCSYRITPNMEWFSSYRSGNSGFVYLGDDSCCNIVGSIDIRIKMYDGIVITLSDVRHISDLKKYLISLGTLHKNGFIPKADEDRETIRIAKVKVNFTTEKYKTEGILDYVHSDVWGPTREQSLGGSLYYVTFTDDFSRKVWVYFLKHKSEDFAKFKLSKAEVENQTGLPKSFWVEAVSMACYQQITTDIISDERSKLDPKFKQCIFLGYKKGVKGYKFWDPAARKMVTSHDAVFNEQFMVQQHQNEMSKIGSSSDTLQMELEPHPVATENRGRSNPTSGDPVATKSGGSSTTNELQAYNLAKDKQRRTNVKPPSRLGYEDMVSFALLVSGDEPTTFHGAITSQEKKERMGAVVEEMESLHKNQTWELFQLPKGKKVTGYKWVYRKTNSIRKRRGKVQGSEKGIFTVEGD
ncbi:Retrovirus-related Pol polyprotein from transposon TNT 1-94 [Sesamum angolense]|uniref:Retrovirus-related Pol polyprotein from transposon TNT 1-94 n=1 Tax=Sesamum angolense TaxID=2727404 RepID=A0AAE2BHN4_9LAMI|nr:Retrovirus-related Pol polyprotein from transposon TNT 1-94 [Sesamum angolense]